MLVFGAWTAEWFTIAAVFPSNRTILLNEDAADIAKYVKQGGKRWVVENVMNALDTPGEFLVDWGAATLYLLPPSGTQTLGELIRFLQQ